MRLSSQVRPISHVKAHAAEILDSLAESGEPLVITQNGEAKAVLMDLASYERTRDTLALLKLLALGQQDIDANRVTPARDAIGKLKARHRP